MTARYLIPDATVIVEFGYADVRVAARWRVRAAGAVVLSPPTRSCGERQNACRDPGGHRWAFIQSIADVDPANRGGEPGRAL